MKYPRAARLAVCWTFLVAALAVDSMAAPSGPAEVPPADLLVSDWKIGPFYVRPTFEIADAGYSSNPFNSPESVSDVIATIAPGLRLALPFGDSMLSVRQRVGYSFFRDTEEQRRWSASTDIGLDLLFGASELKLHEVFSRTNERFGDEIVTNALRLNNTFVAELITAKDAGAYLHGRFGHDVVRFDDGEQIDGDSIADNLDHTQLTGQLDVLLDVIEAARFLLGATVESQTYRIDANRDGLGYFTYGGLRFEPGGPLVGDVRVGYRSLEVDNEVASDRKGIGWRGQLTLELAGASALEFRSSRANDFSEFAVDLSALATRYGLTLRAPLGDAVTIELGGELADVRFPLEPGEDDFTGSYDFQSVTTGLLMALTSDLRLDLEFGYRQLNSDSRRGYDGYTFTTGLRYGL